MTNRDTKIIGYFAYRSKIEIICTGEQACIIAGREIDLKNFINELYPGQTKMFTIKKTKFGEIKNGLLLGASYAFDKQSYERFYPLALEEGLDVKEADFDSQKKTGNRFFTVQLKFIHSK